MTNAYERSGAVKHSGLGSLRQPNDGTLEVRTFWSPLPAWTIGAAGSIAGLLVAVLVASVSGIDSDNLTAIGLSGAAAGYFVLSIAWALIGPFGGDEQIATFDLATDRARVRQSLFWLIHRHDEFELDSVIRLHLWSRRGRLLNRITSNHHVVIALEDRPPLALGRYPTEGEAEAIAKPLATFLDVPLRRKPLDDATE